MAYPDKIEEEAIYLSSGNPLPKDVDAIMQTLNHDSFQQAFQVILLCVCVCCRQFCFVR